MKTLWEKLSEETRKQLTIKDVEFKEKFGYSQQTMYWFNKLSKINSHIELPIDQWSFLKDDLGLDSIDDTYRRLLNEVY
jgi:hypothetical protein